ncbi:MAG: glycosyltransferase family 4 protein [Gammaproteobacteria bacterium]
MNLAFCLFKYFPFGGLQRDFIRIAQECLRRGHAVHVYTMAWEGANELGLPVTLIPAKGLQNHTRAQNFITEVHKQCANKPYDLLVGFNKMPGLDVYYAADTCFQAKARNQHGSWYRLTPRYRHLVKCEEAVFSNQSKTEILLISQLQQAEFVQYYQTNPARFHLLPPGIAKDRIAPDNAAEIRKNLRQELALKEDEFLLLMVGSGFKTKGLDRILLGFAHLPSELKKRSRLYIIGKDQTKSFEHQAKKLGINDKVSFLGGRDDVPRFLLGADLLLHPAYNENTGTVLLEALASGLPVLTTDVCGYAHFIQEAHAGQVLPSPFQQTQFNQTLRDMLLSPIHAIWQKNALAFAKQADIYSMPEQAVNMIESLGR